MLSSHATAWPATSAASTAGRPCDSLTSWMAAAAARLAGLAAGMRSLVASVTRARIAFASSSARERQCHRRRRIKAERERAPLRDDEPRHGRSAERGEFGKPLPVETFDRQREHRFAGRGDENGPPSVEFAKAAADAGVPLAAEQSRACAGLHVTHSQTFHSFGRDRRTPRARHHSGRKRMIFVR